MVKKLLLKRLLLFEFILRASNTSERKLGDTERGFLAGILALAAFLRLYRISEYMTFLGDEGRDVLVAYGILHGNFTLLGPRSSAADFFYGPIYYYMIAPFLWLFRYDPVGPAVMIALIGTATVFLVYKVGKELFDSSFAGLAAAALYAVSPLVIAYSRSSWNPNPLPFVSLLALYMLYKGIQKKNLWRFLVVGLLLGIGLQMQYLALFLATIIAIFTFLGTWIQEKTISAITLIKRYALIFIGFLIGFSPFLAFEVKHGFPNLKTIFRFIFTQDFKHPEVVHMSFLGTIENVLFRLFGRLVTRFPPPEQVNVRQDAELYFLYVFTIVIIFISVIMLFRTKDKLAKLLLIIWLILGVGFFGFYKDNIYDYHFGFMFTLPFLLIGNAISNVGKNLKFVGKILAVLAFLFLFLYNLDGNPFKFSPNRQKDQVREISEFVLSKIDNKPYNFALITGGNSDHAYRYFFKLHGKNPVTIENEMNDPARKTVTQQLLVVCETNPCAPLGHPLWEIAGFGRATISAEWDVSVVKVYKLQHYRETLK